jgi:hypothetical protein
VAAKLGLTRKAVYLRVARDMLPYRKWGRTLVFVEAELDQFLAELPGCSVQRALDMNALTEAGTWRR